MRRDRRVTWDDRRNGSIVSDEKQNGQTGVCLPFRRAFRL